MPSSALRSLRQATLFPYTTLFRSGRASRTDVGKKHSLQIIAKVRNGTERRTVTTATPAWWLNLLGELLPLGVIGKTIQSQICQGQKDRKSTRLNSSHLGISYAVFCFTLTPSSHTLSLHDALPIWPGFPDGRRQKALPSDHRESPEWNRKKDRNHRHSRLVAEPAG